MKVMLEMEITQKDFNEGSITDIPKKDFKEELTQRLFEACEDWVLKGQQPDLEFKEE